MAGNPQRPRPPPNRRRDKIQLSCDPCRHRKLRCDRQHPCGACSRRGITTSCNYVGSASSSTPVPDTQPSAAPRQSTNIHERISELESLVVTLMKGQPLPSPAVPRSPRPSSIPSAHGLSEIRRPKISRDRESISPTDPGTLNLRESGTSYIQSGHWEAILTKIRGLKEGLVTDSKPPPGSHLFYGPNRHASRDEILAAIPPRPLVDRLMALHFDSYFVAAYLIHGKKFLREYESFWEDSSTTSIAWIGLMFSMLYIAAQLQIFAIDSTDGRAELLKAEYLTMTDAFREKAVQCLILARYTTGGPYILETLIMIVTGQSVLLKDSAADGWLGISMILHLAMRMGYHRDPDHFPGISPFEAEMRRRIWITILQLDISLSLERGLPRNATDAHIDTKQPQNLRDCDFDEDTTEMPSPRPETEWTPILPLIARGQLISALGLICDINTDVKSPSRDEVTKIDALLEDVHKRAIPPVLRWESMPHPITDSPNLVVQRVSVETTYHKSRILLYWRALISHSRPEVRRQSPDWERDRERDRDENSVRICLDSALKILSFQQMLHEESQPFGRLCQLRWKVTHIFNQDVLLATSVLCLYLQDINRFELLQPESAGPSRTENIRQQLTISYSIWLQISQSTSTASVEAGKVAKALSIVLGLESPEEASSADDGTAESIASYDFTLTDFYTTMPHSPNEFGAGSAFNNNQCE